jgi:hypothetical protein
MSGSSPSPIKITITGVDRASKTLDQINARIAAMRAPADRMAKSIAKFGDVTGLTTLGKEMRNVAQHSLEAFGNVTRLVGPLGAITGAASLAGMAKLTAEWADLNSKIGFAAQRAGIGAGQLNALQGAAQLAGSSAASLASGITTLNDNLFNATAGRAPEAIQAFNYLGIAFHDAAGHSRAAAAVLPELADKLAGIQDPTMQAQLATMLLGGAAEELLPFLRRGAAGIAEYTAIAQRLNPVTEANVVAANQLREAQVELSLAARGVGNSIATALEPELTPLLRDLATWLGNNRELIGQDVKQFVDTLATTVVGLAKGTNELVGHLGGWKTITEGIIALKLAGWVSGVIFSFGPLGIALAGIIASMEEVERLGKTGIMGGPQNWPVGSPLWQGMSPEEQSNYVNSPRSQEFLNQRGGNPNAYSPWNPGSWLGRTDSQGPLSYFNRRPGAPGGPGAALGTAERNRAGAESLAFWMSKGLTRERAAGMAAQEIAESGGDPNARGDYVNGNPTAAGGYQWHPGRAAAILAGSGIDIRTANIQQQREAAYWELTQGNERATWTNLNRVGTADEAGRIATGFERPGDRAGQENYRAGIATRLAAGGPRLLADPAPGIGNGTGAAPADSKLTGDANLNIKLSGFPPGTQTSANATGPIWAAPPRIEQAMPLGAGG